MDNEIQYYYYETFDELVQLFEKHFKNNDQFQIRWSQLPNLEILNIEFFESGEKVGQYLFDHHSIALFHQELGYKHPELHQWFRDQTRYFEYQSTKRNLVKGQDIQLGTQAYACDPCHSPKRYDFLKIIDDLRPGTWHTAMETTEKAGHYPVNLNLIIWHENVTLPENDTFQPQEDGLVSPDGGCVGIFNKERFDELTSDEDRHHEWYLEEFKPFESKFVQITEKNIDQITTPIEKRVLKLTQSFIKEHELENPRYKDPLALLRAVDALKADHNTLALHPFTSKKEMNFSYLYTDQYGVANHSLEGAGGYLELVKDQGEIVAVKINYEDIPDDL